MRISCSHCRKKFTITEDQICDYTSEIIFSCPKCETDISVDLKTLTQAVNASIQDLPSGDTLKKIILDSVRTLPPMPQVAIKARKIISDPDSGFSELASVIETDPGITTQVLKIANSAYYGLVSEVSTIQRASVIMGTKTLLEVLTLACSSTLLGNNLRGYELDTGDLWMHSLSTAYCSKIIAKKCRPELAEDAFTAGLIHDSGKLILDPYVVERKKSFTQLLKDEKISFLDAEKEILGFDHGEIASEVCMKWQIPENISQAIKYHHNPGESSEKDLTYIIHLSDAIAMMSGIGIGYDGMLYEIDEHVFELLGISSSDINSIMHEVVTSVESITG